MALPLDRTRQHRAADGPDADFRAGGRAVLLVGRAALARAGPRLVRFRRVSPPRRAEHRLRHRRAAARAVLSPELPTALRHDLADAAGLRRLADQLRHAHDE